MEFLKPFQSERPQSMESLKASIDALLTSSFNYQEHIPKPPSESQYGRNILQMEPIEVAVLHWPSKVESAIHLHENFFGYVVVLEGELENHSYQFVGTDLLEDSVVKAKEGGVIPELDGVIHKLKNAGDHRAITLHVYYPPLKSFEGMQIFNLQNGSRGVLSGQAQSASWEEPKSSFRSIKQNAFQFKSIYEQTGASHRMIPVVPKPQMDELYAMIGAYYNEQAEQYDFFDLKHPSRNTYTEKLNDIIANELRHAHVEHFLSLACGTGRRAKDIQQKSESKFEITGVDLSPSMCKEAEKRGVHTICSKWIECDLGNQTFDIATFLYAFGHMPNAELRLKGLRKVHKHLKKNGSLYLDVFNREDQSEWGPKSDRLFDQGELEAMNYERGDIFYRKKGGKSISFLHYFTHLEIIDLLVQAGFEIAWVKHVGYVKKAGEFTENSNEGTLFIKATKV